MLKGCWHAFYVECISARQLYHWPWFVEVVSHLFFSPNEFSEVFVRELYEMNQAIQLGCELLNTFK